MGTGYIQLLTAGNSVNIFNYNPNISFFKIYYRRHTNFFINNMTIEGDNINNNNNNNQNNILSNSKNTSELTKNILDFTIPKNGDLLGKSYLELNFDEFYFEMFGFNNNLISTLNQDLLLLYDSYYIKTNNFNINDIKYISTIKLNFYKNEKIYSNPYLTLVSSAINNSNELLNIIKSIQFIDLEVDLLRIFYNIDLNFNFFSFDIFKELSFIDNAIFKYLTSNINYKSIKYIQIDFKNSLISLRTIFLQKENYILIMNTIFSSYVDILNGLKITDEYIYISCDFNNQLYFEFINISLKETEILDLEIIINELESSKIMIKQNLIQKINFYILNKNITTTIYLVLYNGGIISNCQLTILKETLFFGNLTNEYYNDNLINNSNKILDIFNLNSNTISIKLLIKLFVSLVCDNDNVSIKNFLNIINNPNANNNEVKNLLSYNYDLNKLNDKLIENFMDPNVLLISNKCFEIIIYTKNVFKYFNTDFYVQPFTNSKISFYGSTIINFYIYSNILKTFNNIFNSTSDDFNFLVTQFIFYLKSTSLNGTESYLDKNISLNYVNNNNLFKLVTYKDTSKDLINYFSNNIDTISIKNIINKIITNYLYLFITESLTIINYISNKSSNFIYLSNGKLTSIFYNNNNSDCVIPLTSYIFVYTHNSKESCKTNSLTNSNIFYNTNKITYVSRLRNNLSKIVNNFFNLSKNLIIPDITYDDTEFINNSKFISYINKYYSSSYNLLKDLETNSLNDCIEQNAIINFDLLYPFILPNSFDLNGIIMLSLFTYVDNNLFNGSFSNLTFNKYTNCSSPVYSTDLNIELNYLKFIFSINSPLYRIYFLFTWLSNFTIEAIQNNILIPDDINTLRDITLYFLISYISYFNVNNYRFNKLETFVKFDMSLIFNLNYLISNNFICFDSIDIFNDINFIENLKNSSSSTYLMIYNNYYICQNKFDNYKINNNIDIDNIPNTCNKFKYNFDDNIILLFLNVLNSNMKYFLNYKSIYNFVLNFFNKYEFDFEKLISSMTDIFTKNNLYDYKNFYFIVGNNYFYKCYNSAFILGSLFDNVNLLNTKIINDIFSLTTEYNGNIEYDYDYCIKSFNIKKNENYFISSNLNDCLKYFSSQLFDIFDENDLIISQYFLNYIETIIGYTNNNAIFFYKYMISEYDFNNAIASINNYLNIFNSINNFNFSLSSNSFTTNYNQINFYKYIFIVIVYYYIYFINNCLLIDIKQYTVSNNVKNIKFGEFLVIKYTSNIYNDCINNLINIFTNTTRNILLDFSSYNFAGIKNDQFKNSIFNTEISSKDVYNGLIFNILENNSQYFTTNNKLDYNILNISSILFVNSSSALYVNINNLNLPLYNIFYSQIYSLITKINKLYFLSINYYIGYYNKISNSNILDNFINTTNYFYKSSLVVLSNSIYTNLSNSYNSNLKKIVINKYSYRICTSILNNLKNFFIDENYNYLYTLFNFNYSLNYNDNIINNIYLNTTSSEETISEIEYIFNPIYNIKQMYSKYLNNLIVSSLIYEKELNRIIYYLCTNYIISNSFDSLLTKKKIYSKTLYDIVKVFIYEYDVNTKTNTKTYLSNTSIYSNQSVFELFNFENLFGNESFEQNYWINEIISKINVEFNLPNSYYSKYKEFINYMQYYNSSIFKIILNDGTPAIYYFELVENYNELCNLLFNCICANESFSPNNIFVNIVDLFKDNEISSKLIIDTENIKKKNIVFAFFSWIILSSIVQLLIDNFEVNLNIVLEYTIDESTIIEVNLSDVLGIQENKDIINWSINEIYNMNCINDNIFNVNTIPPFVSKYNDIIQIVKYTKQLCSPIMFYNYLTNKIAEIFNSCIGYNDMYTNQLLNTQNSSTDVSLSNLVTNINIIFNNDIDKNNYQLYDLTFYSLKLLGIKINSLIFDLDSIVYNKLYNTSSTTINYKLVYTNSVNNDYNLLLNLQCLLLNNYNISYPNLNNDISIILTNYNTSFSYVNDVLELFKGYIAEFKLSLDLTSTKFNLKYSYFNSRIYNIDYLTNLSTSLNNLSIITPNDYDNITILIGYRYIYNNFFQKYYSYNYNYNNFYKNFDTIYISLYNYYLNLTKNTIAIKNIKNSNMNLYIWMFLNLINSFIANIYYSSTTTINNKDSNTYIPIINNLVKLYFKYNYSFRLNQNISNLDNLNIQSKYVDIPNLLNYNSILKYLINYYYYQLFSSQIDNVDNYKNDVLIFFDTLNNNSNINFLYNSNFLNLIFKFEIVIRYLIYILNKHYNINIIINEDNIIKLNNQIIEYYTNIINISNYLNQKYISNLNNYLANFELFNKIQNSLDPYTFYLKFSQSIQKLIYWINSYSYTQYINLIWEEYFKNYIWEYYTFVDNQYQINKTTLSENDFYFILYGYINHTTLNNNGTIEIINLQIYNLYNEIFSYNGLDNNLLYINPDFLIKLLYNNFDINNIDIIFYNQSNTNNKIDFQEKINLFISVIISYIINTNWGIINFNEYSNTQNYNIRSYINFYNYYYSYLNYRINQEIYLNIVPYDFESNLSTLNELYILYYFILVISTCQYINDNTYYTLLNNILLTSHNYLQYGLKINTINIFKNFALYMDNLNSNILKNNTITNYYKTIQNNSVYECIKYGVQNFVNNVNNYDRYFTLIFNNTINTFFTTENELSYNTFYNIIINTITDLNTNVNIYNSDSSKILTSIYNSIYNTINSKIDTLKLYFDGDMNNVICTKNSNFNNIFDTNNYKSDDLQITIFTLIYNQINNTKINNNVLIILFYYMCFISWSTLGINLQDNYVDINKLFNELANYINSQIITYVNSLKISDQILNQSTSTLNQSTSTLNQSDFFDKLDILLFNNYNNFEFIEATGLFFNDIIYNNFKYLSKNVISNMILLNNYFNITYNNTFGKTNSNNLINNSVVNNQNDDEIKLISNSKKNRILFYKYLLGLVFEFNSSLTINYIKSINNVFTDIKIQENLINYIIDINGGIVNEYGIIKLINKMQLLFDDELISEYNNFNYKVFIENFQNINKQGLLDEMLGIGKLNKDNNIKNGLKPYIKLFMKKNYIIPIKFFFENYSNSIPLISCMYTNIKILTFLNNTNIFKNSFIIKNLTNSNINTSLNLDFILVERDERKSLCYKQIDNLIEKNNYYELVKNINESLNKTGNSKNILDLDFDFDLNNLVKEIIWSFELTIDNYKLIIVKDLSIKDRFLFKTNNFDSTYFNNLGFDFIFNTKFYIDGLRRDGVEFLDSNRITSYDAITTILNPYKYNTKTMLNNLYNTYSFGLEPTSFQPTGAINMSNYNIFKIKVQIDRNKLIKYLNNLGILFDLKNMFLKMSITTYEYNILRYQSGLAGLLFIN